MQPPLRLLRVFSLRTLRLQEIFILDRKLVYRLESSVLCLGTVDQNHISFLTRPDLTHILYLGFSGSLHFKEPNHAHLSETR